MKEEQQKKMRRKFLTSLALASVVLMGVGLTAAFLQPGTAITGEAQGELREIPNEETPLANPATTSASDETTAESESSDETNADEGNGSSDPEAPASYPVGQAAGSNTNSNSSGTGNNGSSAGGSAGNTVDEEPMQPPAPTYTLTYHANGGTQAPVDATAYGAGTLAQVSDEQAMTYKGYVFTGWNSAPEGVGESFAAGSTLEITGNITLYAQWEPAILATSVPVAYGTERSLTVVVQNASDAWWEALSVTDIAVTGRTWRISDLVKDPESNTFTLSSSSQLDSWTTYKLTIAGIAPYAAQEVTFKPGARIPVAVSTSWQASGDLYIEQSAKENYLNRTTLRFYVNGRQLTSGEFSQQRSGHPDATYAGVYYVVIKAGVFTQPGTYEVKIVDTATGSPAAYVTYVTTVNKMAERIIAPLAEDTVTAPDEIDATEGIPDDGTDEGAVSEEETTEQEPAAEEGAIAEEPVSEDGATEETGRETTEESVSAMLP